MKENGVPRENHRPVASPNQPLINLFLFFRYKMVHGGGHCSGGGGYSGGGGFNANVYTTNYFSSPVFIGISFKSGIFMIRMGR